MKEKNLQGETRTGALEWREIYKRLDAARHAMSLGWAPSPEEKKKILRARALELAVEPKEREGEGEFIEVVEFLLAYERYAVESSYVREVYALKEITLLPGMPPFLMGIVNVRGRTLSVIDLRKFFDLPEKGLGDFNKMIIIESGTLELGILADNILGIKKLRADELQPPLPTMTGVREEYLKGITGDRLAVLDAGAILHSKNIVIDENV